jgi:glycosyltransferase involved in cell wall biosynthesis
VRHAAMVFCISDFCRSQVMGLCRPEDWAKLHVVHCGVDPRQYAFQPQSGRPGAVHLLNVGRLVPVKAHALLLEAVQALQRAGRNVCCTIIGNGPECDRLERMARELEIESDVRFAGFVNQDEIRRYYEQADLFVLPSFAEGVPVVLMEAMAMGVPVVTTRIMGIPELIEDGRNGLLVTPGRADELVAAIERLIDDPAFAGELSRHARRTIEDGFDIAAIGRDIHELFARLEPTQDRRFTGQRAPLPRESAHRPATGVPEAV